MRKNNFFLFVRRSFLLLLPLLLKPAQAQLLSKVQGVVDRVDSKQVFMRGGDADWTFDYDKLPQESKEAVDAAVGKGNVIELSYDPGAVVARKQTPLGIRPDCSELPVGIEDLEKLGKNSTDMVDFLKKIPKGTLQGFTFITNTLSLHRGEKGETDEKGNVRGQVSSMWPRVLRSSIDGKMTISYVCDEKNPTYGKVEIIHFDDKSKEFKTTEIDFGNPEKRLSPPEDRVHHNPVSCKSCHSGSTFNNQVSLKPNWPEYFFWSDCKDNRGIQMYGTSDDNMGPTAFRSRRSANTTKATAQCSSSEDRKLVNREKADYSKFKDLQKDNPCFQSLPWPDYDKSEGLANRDNYQYYPYSSSAQTRYSDGFQNYSLRTNARFTDVYSHLMSLRIAGLLQKNKNYEKIKYFLAMEEADCINPIDESTIEKLIPNLKIDKSVKYPSLNDYSLEEQRPILYNFAKSAGLENKDWTMEFREVNNPNYNAVMFKDIGDAKIYNAVGVDIIRDVANSNPEVKKATDGVFTTGVADLFSSKFKCIDDMGAAVKNSERGANRQLCTALRAENVKHLAKISAESAVCLDCEIANANAATQDAKLVNEKKLIASLKEKFTAEQIELGRKLVEEDSKGKCVMCHSASKDILPMDFRFVPSEKDPRKAESIAVNRARAQEDLHSRFKERVVDTETMPPFTNELNKEDRQAIFAYLMSIADENK